MAGHNKWTQIKHKKGATDAKRSKLFSLLSRVVILESKKVSGDRNHPSLRAAVLRARAANMPNDNIERAIAKGVGQGSESYEEVFYEAYGPGGVALIIEGVTDNKNRTTPEIKHLLDEHGGSLGGQGSALWAFEKGAEGWVAKSQVSIDQVTSEKLDALLRALEGHDDIKNVFTNFA